MDSEFDDLRPIDFGDVLVSPAPPTPANAPALPVHPQLSADRGSQQQRWLAGSVLSCAAWRRLAIVAVCIATFLGILLLRSVDWPDDLTPGPTPDMVILDEPGLHVLFAEESDERDKWTADQIDLWSSVPLRQWLDANCTKASDGRPAYRFFDDDTPLESELPVWSRMMDAVGQQQPPSIVISNAPHGGTVLPLPATAEDAIALLEKWKNP